MFGTLIESRAVPQRRPGSSLASILVHGAIITGALVATARDPMTPRPPEPLLHPITYTTPAAPPPPPARAVRTASLVPAGPALFQRLVIPTVIPTSIPVVDFTATPTSPDFSAHPIGSSSILCQEDHCPGHGPTGGDQAVLSARDIAIQLREQPSPRYPESLRRAGVEGSVLVRFVVDTTGRIDMNAVEILSADHELFAASVRDVLAKMRFSPSMVGERKVKALAIMPFRFTLR